MNVVLVSRFSGGGGVAAYVRYLAGGLARAGHAVRVICMSPPDGGAHVPPGVIMHCVAQPLRSYRWVRVPLLGPCVPLVRNLIYAWRVRRTLLRIARLVRPDVVEYADIEAEGFFHPGICPYVVKLHGCQDVLAPYYTRSEQLQYPWVLRLMAAMEARMIRGADAVSSPSRWLAAEVSRLYAIASSRIADVPYPMDTDFFSPGPIAETARGPCVLYSGRLEARKGAFVFAKAIPAIARKVPEAEFVFLGVDRRSPAGASSREDIQTFLKGQGVGDRVRFHGDAPPMVFRDFYRRATVVVNPSLWENCPYTLLEAMSTAKPVVASRASGMKEMIVHGESGLFFEPEDSEDLARQVVALLEDGALRERLGTRAREIVLAKYGMDAATAGAVLLYERIIGRGRPS